MVISGRSQSEAFTGKPPADFVELKKKIKRLVCRIVFKVTGCSGFVIVNYDRGFFRQELVLGAISTMTILIFKSDNRAFEACNVTGSITILLLGKWAINCSS